jgi:broad specificity phosphatase PhoE
MKALHANDTVLVVTHGSPMVEILKLAADEKNRTLDPGNAEFRILSLSENSAT